MAPALPIHRRGLLTSGAVGLAAVAAPATWRRAGGRSVPLPEPFGLGVASGDPTADGFVIWTRVLADPARLDFIATDAWVVSWEVAEDDRFARVVARGTAAAGPDDAHTLHVEVGGLRPGREHWYRFRLDNAVSATGRAVTLPEAADRYRFAFASCQQYEHGFYAAWRDAAEQRLDAIVFLGDYIYEGRSGVPDLPRRHIGEGPETLDEYRLRYALYKSDPDLQAAHASAPWFAVWDDHEVQNDYADDRAEDLRPREAFLLKRAAAYRAWWEHMPMRPAKRPVGPSTRIHQRAAVGDLVEFALCDVRQYRSPQVCPWPGRGGGGQADATCGARLDPALTMLGMEQERWLHEGFARGRARWNVVAQGVPFAPINFDTEGGERRRSDSWDGYVAARERLLDAALAARLSNPVVLSGDLHVNVVLDLRRGGVDARGPAVATEFVGTSISSRGAPRSRDPAAMIAANPHMRYIDGGRRGYGLATVARDTFEVALRVVEDAAVRASPVSTLATFAVENGRPGAVRT